METTIKELKELALAHKVALEFDYVPGADQGEEAYDFITEGLGEEVEKDDLYNAIGKYEGNSTGDLESKVFNLINKL